MSLIALSDPNAPGSPSVALTLDAAMLQKLGIAQLPAGTEVFVTARAVMQNDPANPQGPGALQMVAMGIEPVQQGAAQRLWGSAPGTPGGGGGGPKGGVASTTPVSDVSASAVKAVDGGSIMLG